VKKVLTDTAKGSKDGDGGEEDETNAAQDLEAVTLWIPIRPECHIVHCKTTNNNNNNKVFQSLGSCEGGCFPSFLGCGGRGGAE